MKIIQKMNRLKFYAFIFSLMLAFVPQIVTAQEQTWIDSTLQNASFSIIKNLDATTYVALISNDVTL